MDITYDVETVSDAGFDRYLTRSIIGDEKDPFVGGDMERRRTLDASNLVGGVIGNEGILYLGSKQVRIDGKNQRIVINDGTTDRVIIGYLG